MAAENARSLRLRPPLDQEAACFREVIPVAFGMLTSIVNKEGFRDRVATMFADASFLRRLGRPHADARDRLYPLFALESSALLVARHQPAGVFVTRSHHG